MKSILSRDELIQRIGAVAVLRGEFVLRSGRTSNYYLDKYLFSTQPDILATLGHMFAAHADESVDVLAGAELGGIPLVSAASIASGKPCVFIRNQKKDYGTAKQLEGRVVEGARVMIVEDICTSGGQVLEAANVLQAAGAQVVHIVGTIDRLEGARERIESAGFRFSSLLTKDDLGL